MDQAAGQTLDFGTVTNPTPEGQQAASDTAIIGNAYALFCALANSSDPGFAQGRFLDAICRIYFLQRNPGQSTAVSCTCIGAVGTIILPNSLAQDTNVPPSTYFCVSGGQIGASGQITLQFQNMQTGPIPCPAGTLTTIYRTIPGWDAIVNPADGVLGENVETDYQLRVRRKNSVAANSLGQDTSVEGAVLKVPGVVDAYVTDNYNGYPVAITPKAIANGSISGTTLTISEVLEGTVAVGQSVTGSAGKNVPVLAGTVIVSGSGLSWVVNHSQTVNATTLNFGGVVVPPNSLYAAVAGGLATDVAQAIWSKKSPGCAYYPGNTTATAYDTSPQYPAPGIAYTVVFEDPDPLPVVFVVNIKNNIGVPSDATTQIQNAIINAFAGGDGGPRATIGSTIFASRFYAPVAALGSWAEIVSLLLGTQDDLTASITGSLGATYTATASGTSLTASSVTGFISSGDTISGTGVPAGTTILSQSSGSAGGAGVYITSVATTASASSITTTSSNALTVSAVASGALAAGQFLFDETLAIPEGTTILSQLSGSAGSTGAYKLSAALAAFASETIQAVAADQPTANVMADQVPTTEAQLIQVNLV